MRGTKACFNKMLYAVSVQVFFYVLTHRASRRWPIFNCKPSVGWASKEDYHCSLPWRIITPSRGLSPSTTLGPPRKGYHLSLPWGIVTHYREDYHLPLPWGHLERIITFHYPGGLSPPVERITTSDYPGGSSPSK